MHDDVKDLMTQAYERMSRRDVLGISKDGRPVYTPFYSGGKAYDSCDVDVCNGKFIKGQYSYVSTMFHPYIMGCYGVGGGSQFR